MSRWLTTLVVLLLLFAFVLPNPAGAGAATGNAFKSLGVFLENAVGAASGADRPAGSVLVYPNGGVASGDGTAPPRQASASASAVGAVPALKPVESLPYSPPVRLHIPSIGVTSGFVAVGLDAGGALQVPPEADVVGWYEDAPTPGERGPAVATAHVDWKHEKGVFYDLGRLKPGSDVTIDRADGVTVAFRVSRVAEFSKTLFPTDEVYGTTEGSELRLITCGGRFDSTTRSYDNNIVIFAQLVGMV